MKFGFGATLAVAALVAAGVDPAAARYEDPSRPVAGTTVAGEPEGAAATAGIAETVTAAGHADPSQPVPQIATVATTADEEAPPAQQTQAQSSGRPYGDLIAQHARVHGLPVALAQAVVRVESNFNAKARGRAGEVGLMQIKPQTARGIGYTGSTQALYDPNTNLEWGMKYLAGAYELAGGDICGTVMRYQGGHYAKRMSGANRTYCGKLKTYMAKNGQQVAGL